MRIIEPTNKDQETMTEFRRLGKYEHEFIGIHIDGTPAADYVVHLEQFANLKNGDTVIICGEDNEAILTTYTGDKTNIFGKVIGTIGKLGERNVNC